MHIGVVADVTEVKELVDAAASDISRASDIVMVPCL